ncbi:MAG TPA: serine/threonine-protein kinase [Trebonia sp.]
MIRSAGRLVADGVVTETGSGTLIASRYRLQGRALSGAIGEVWQAYDLLLGRPVTLRLLRRDRAGDAGRFLAVARRATQLRHPGIVQVYDYGQAGTESIPFLVTEPVGGTTLATVMPAGPLEPAWVLGVIGQVTSALDTAHTAGLVHQDISPGTILLAPGGAVKLTDFGSSHVAGATTGGPGYLAPERLRGSPAMPASDLYSLGVVAWECLVRTSLRTELEGGGLPLPRLPAVVSSGVASLVADLTAVDPADRPASAAQVTERVGELLAVPLRSDEPRQADSPLVQLAVAPVSTRPAGDTGPEAGEMSHSLPENPAHAD